jgi:hypothetical protein
MKKTIYVISTSFLGLLLATILHAVIEMIALDIIFSNPERFAPTFWWQNWSQVHSIGSNILWLAGLIVGLHLGLRWWEPYGSRPGFYYWKKKLVTSR